MCRTLNIQLLLFILLTPCVFALPTDMHQKLHILADAGSYNYKTGVNIYEGHVKVDQGASHLTADKLITKSNPKHEIQEATAYGLLALAHYWTIPKLGEAEIHAHAEIIRFFPIRDNLTLEKQVFVTQGENNFRGELVYIDNNKETITVPPTKTNRAVLVYDPDK